MHPITSSTLPLPFHGWIQDFGICAFNFAKKKKKKKKKKLSTLTSLKPHTQFSHKIILALIMIKHSMTM